MKTDQNIDVQDARVVKALASLHQLFGQDKTAASLMDFALWLNPKDGEAVQMLVRISDRLRDSEKVLSLCHTLETLQPDLLDHSANVAKGKALARLGLTEDAQSYLLA